MRDRFTLRSNSAEELRIALRQLYDYVDRRINGNTTDRGTQTDAVRQVVQPTASLEAVVTHTHTFASLTSKPTTLAGYGITDAALSTHNHDGSYSPLGHTHNISNVSGLQTALDGKTPYLSTLDTSVDSAVAPGFYLARVNLGGLHDGGLVLVSEKDSFNMQTQFRIGCSSVAVREGTTGSWSAWKALVLDNDSRLTDARPASDVYAWAKAATKPSYTFSEIGSKPTTLAGYGITDAATSGHTHASVASADLLNALANYIWNTSISVDTYGLGVTTSFVRASDGWPGYGTVLTVKSFYGGGGTLQLYTPYGASFGSGVLQYRYCDYNGDSPVWGPMRTLIDSSNIGSQSVNYAASAGNADTLDGLHASAFATAGHNHEGTYPFSITCTPKPAASQKLLIFVAERAFRVKSTGHKGKCYTNPSYSSADLTLKKNGVSFGTLTFTTAGAFTQSVTETSFAVDDIFTIEAPISQNATFANFGVTVAAVLA